MAVGEFYAKYVWVPDAAAGFSLGQIVDIKFDTATVKTEGSSNTCEKILSIPYDALHEADIANSNKDVEDNCALMHLNEATLLNNVRSRYQRDQIYTYVANVLIAVNPYFELKFFYGNETIEKYKGASLGVLPPHIFAIADKAYRDMKRLKENQSIIVSGESGAGKTESQKYLLHYLCHNWGSESGPIERRILDSNPILEAFGNAKTLRNNNSSRFGKFVEIHFNLNSLVSGGHISHYLLEKSRVVGQQLEERNFHIFYQLLAGADSNLRDKLSLGTPDDFTYLSRGCTQYFASTSSLKLLKPNQLSLMHKKRGAVVDPVIDDVKDFQRLDACLTAVGLVNAEKFDLFSILAGLLHLGNVEFHETQDDSKGGCAVQPDSFTAISTASRLLGIDKNEISAALIARIMHANKGSGMATVIKVPLKTYEAKNARDALSKAIYSRLFDFVVKSINDSIPFNASDRYIGILDIAGFEYFTINSFEQFCINYCNEKLQQFFNDRILKQEQELYEKERLAVKKINYVDNLDCIDLIEAKCVGILDLLDEESKLPTPNPHHFTLSLHEKHKNHFRLTTPRKSKLKEHREIRDEEGFLVRHFAGAVCYYTAKFIEKNNDALHSSLEYLLVDSQSALLKKIFSSDRNRPKNLDKKPSKLSFVSVGAKFRGQLKMLIADLEKTGTNFIKCVKPNDRMTPHSFEGGSVLSQLQCSGMTSVLNLMQQGYPSRTQFSDLYETYRKFLPENLSRLDPRLFCKCLFKALGLNDQDFKFGMTKVFFRPGKFAQFDQMLRSDQENLKNLISSVKIWLMRTRWKKAQFCSLSVIKLKNKILWRRQQIIVLQSLCRMFLVKKRHKNRMDMMINIRNCRVIFDETLDIVKKSPNSNEAVVFDLKNLEKSLDDLIGKIKDWRLSENLLQNEYHHVLNSVQNKLCQLRMQAEIDQTLKKCNANPVIKKSSVTVEKVLAECSSSSKKIAVDSTKSKVDSQPPVLLRENIAKEDCFSLLDDVNIRQEIIRQQAEELRLMILREQEKRDREIALRLAVELNRNVSDLQENFSQNIGRPHVNTYGSYDLSNMKFPELRDIINTSSDIKLLEACRDEFNRRLIIFHKWKSSNSSNHTSGTVSENQNKRIPDDVCLYADRYDTLKPLRKLDAVRRDPGLVQKQRFFRVPFSRPSDLYRGTLNFATETQRPQKTGFWLAHFDGQWVARQLEISADGKHAVLLVVGKNDANMCELSLEQTGLLLRPHAEIRAEDFEAQWAKYVVAKNDVTM